jgi:hypothetical protein
VCQDPCGAHFPFQTQGAEFVAVPFCSPYPLFFRLARFGEVASDRVSKAAGRAPPPPWVPKTWLFTETFA